MKKMLKKKVVCVYHYIDGERIAGCPSGLRGDVSGLRGNVSGLRGDVSGLRGDVSGLRGDVSGLSGDVSGLSGDVDSCCISEEERQNGIDVSTLVGE